MNIACKLNRSLLEQFYGILMKYFINLTRMLGMIEGWHNKLTWLLNVISVGCMYIYCIANEVDGPDEINQ